MTNNEFNPLFGAVPAEIPLPKAPLVTVLFQVRFPEIISIHDKAFIGGFQELIRNEYPGLTNDKLKTVAVDERRGVVSANDDLHWRFTNSDRSWRISLSSTFFSLETRQYVSRADFIDKLERALDALEKSIRPTHVTRMGMRYIDRVPLTTSSSIEGMLRTEMMGVAGTDLANNIVHSFTETACNVEEGQMLARWGSLPPSGSHDLDVLPPISEPSWFLDLDAFADRRKSPISFNVPLIRDTAHQLASRCYAFFRWAVTEDFLKAFGGITK